MADTRLVCACTSGRERSTRPSEASPGHKRKPGPVLVLVSMRMQPH